MMPHARKMFIPDHRYRLLVGLGNPGSAYVNTYHNAGAYCIRKLAEREKFKRHTQDLFEYYTGHDQVLMVPRTFMNQSGEAVAQAMRFFRASHETLLVIHDDFDLPLGTAQYATGRGSAGHWGVQSVIEALGTNQFTRLRLGVRTIPGKAGELVLRTMPLDARNTLTHVCYSLEIINST